MEADRFVPLAFIKSNITVYRKIIRNNLLPPHNNIIVEQLLAVLLITGRTTRAYDIRDIKKRLSAT